MYQKERKKNSAWTIERDDGWIGVDYKFITRF